MPLQSVTSGHAQPADKADCHVGNTVEIGVEEHQGKDEWSREEMIQ